MAGSIIAAEGAAGVSLTRLTVTVVLTMVLYWVSHTYAELVDLHVTMDRSPRAGDLWMLITEEWSIVGASLGPLAVILLFSLLGADDDTAVAAGLYSTVVILAGWALIAGLRIRLTWLELTIYVVVSTLIGCAIVALAALLH